MPVKHLPKRVAVNSPETSHNDDNNSKCIKSGNRGSEGSDGPHIINVIGLSMDNDSPEYVVEKMGNQNSQEEETRHEGQLDPLTKSKNAKNKSDDTDDADDVVVEKHSDNKETDAAHLDHKHNSSLKSEIETIDTESDKEGKNISNNNDNKTDGDGGASNKIKKEGSNKPDHEIIEVAGRDDVDAASTYSLFMEKDFRYYFQHPYSRIFVAYFVVFCNFLIYAEDPVAHSRKECLIPMIGNDFAFIGTRYPPNAWSLLKVVFWLTGLVIGLIVGKLLVHGLLFNKLFRLKMFTEDQGSWMIMFLCSLITIFIMSLFYNLFLMIGGEDTEPYRISDLMGVRNTIFMKVAACGTWCGDFFTAWMVTDIMLQEKLYPGWARPVRGWWKRQYNRIILFWIVVAITSFVVIFIIATDYIQWDKLNRDFLPTNEVSRAFLASFILVMDLMIVMQDWDFPHFTSAIDIKLPGLNTAHIRFEIPKCLKREVWKVHISGRWFNYGILFLVMLLDLNMWKNQIFFVPYDYGQYTGPEDRIYTVQDDYSLETFNETQLNYAYRNNMTNPNTGELYIKADTHMNTKYFGTSLAVKALAFVPSLAAFIIFGVLIWLFGRFKPTESDPYAGRLKKRMKKRFSFRMPWRRKEEVRRKIHAVPKLLYFKKKSVKGEKEVTEPKELPTEGFTSDTEEK